MSEHTHDHGHNPDHGHDHDHHHDGDTYYLDQICMIGISGAFGAICLALYIANARKAAGAQSMLGLLLNTQFHLFVLASGIVLCLVSAVRAIALWRSTGRPAHVHDHDHDHVAHHHHEHGPDCTHEHGGSEHEPADAAIAAGHAPLHAHAHHGHDHGAEDHDHGWAPWRYVLLLVPIILFGLGLPNKGPQAQAVTIHVDSTHELAGYAGMIASVPMYQGELLSWAGALYLSEQEGRDVPFMDLYENYAKREETRAEMSGKTVSVRGLFVPMSANVFGVQRFRIACCGADAVPLTIPMVSRESLLSRTDLKQGQWVKVTGVIEFQKIGGATKAVLRVLNLAKVKACPPESIYVQ